MFFPVGTLETRTGGIGREHRKEDALELYVEEQSFAESFWVSVQKQITTKNAQEARNIL